jgi:branched-chain amino acid transport system permease protein
VTWRRIAVGAALAALVALPLAGATFYVDLLTKIMILATFAASLDLLVGYTGLVSFGHAAFFGIGAYSLALLAPRYEAASLWPTALAAMVLSAAAALVVGLFVLRTKGIYFIMVTLAFAQMFFFLFHDTELGRGSDGITMNFKPSAAAFGVTPFDLSDPRHQYYLVLAVLALALLFLRTLLRSPLGRALQGIRGNEHRMRSLGFPVFRYKLASFTIAGGLAGLAGYLSALQYGFVNPELLSWHQSGNVLLMVILGGIGSLYGSLAGAFVLVVLQEVFQALTTHWQLPFGLTILLLVLFLPGGLASAADRLRGARGGAA